MRLFLGAACLVLGFSSAVALAAPTTYKFQGTLTDSWGGTSPVPEWQFAVGQTFTGEIVYDAEAVSSSWDYINDPNWKLTFHTTPLVSLSFSIDIAGQDYHYDVPTTDLTSAAWQYVAVGQGEGGWNGVSIRTQNYPENWVSGPPSAPVPPSAYVGPMNPHMVEISLANSLYYNPGAADLLPDTSADIDLAALHAGLIGPETNYQFAVRFSDPYSWVIPGQENLQAIIYGRIDRLWVAGSAVPEPTTWALMIAGFAFAGAAIRRGKLVASAA